MEEEGNLVYMCTILDNGKVFTASLLFATGAYGSTKAVTDCHLEEIKENSTPQNMYNEICADLAQLARAPGF